jgi:hypothetical protein
LIRRWSCDRQKNAYLRGSSRTLSFNALVVLPAGVGWLRFLSWSSRLPCPRCEIPAGQLDNFAGYSLVAWPHRAYGHAQYLDDVAKCLVRVEVTDFDMLVALLVRSDKCPLRCGRCAVAHVSRPLRRDCEFGERGHLRRGTKTGYFKHVSAGGRASGLQRPGEGMRGKGTNPFEHPVDRFRSSSPVAP